MKAYNGDKLKKEKKFNRYNVLVVIMIALFLIIGGRLYYLQAFKGKYYR